MLCWVALFLVCVVVSCPIGLSLVVLYCVGSCCVRLGVVSCVVLRVVLWCVCLCCAELS